MIEYIKYRYRLGELLRERRRIIQKYKPQYANAKDSDDLGVIGWEEMQELTPSEDRMHRLMTDWLWEQAHRFMVPIPDTKEEGMWENSMTIPETSHLSSKGISTLRARIRKERKERWLTMIIWVAPVTGLVGAVTGLLAIILK